ncbi:MAG: type IV toxin-antitoxin system AbiEi family antitoxin domain-containing protein [Solirubrobacterales bacterium]
MAELARCQHGVVSLPQLIDHGFSPGGVRRLARAGRLHRIHRGVYALGPAALSPLGNRMAAVLACGPGSLLAGRSAGAHLGLIANSSSSIDVMTPRQVRRRGIRAHAISILAPPDRMIHLSVPCTSVARTMLDLAAARRTDVGAALEGAEALGTFDLRALTDVIERNAGHRGVRRLREAVATMTAPGPRFRSEFERRFLPIAGSAGLPEPLINQTIALTGGAIEVDYHWPDLHLVVECDGYEFHRRRRDFREDRRRDRRLAAVGIQCLRYVWEDLADPDGIVRELREVAQRSSPARAATRPPRRAGPPGPGRWSRGT